jgi:hypothetical protein
VGQGTRFILALPSAARELRRNVRGNA